MNKTETYDVAVVGAGAAGLLCAGLLGRQGLRVLLVEKNTRPGRKLLITGKGRCNVTNNCTREEFLAAVRSNNRFLYSASQRFTPMDTMQFFEERGVRLKTERGNRVFPVSDKAAEVVDALVHFCKGNGVQLYTGTVSEILRREEGVCGIIVDGKTVQVPRVVVATGGASYPGTGSTGDGYRFAEAVGHTILPPKPALVPLVTHDVWCRELMGLSLKNVTLTLREIGKKALYSELGEMLFTHFGVSGPLVLSASSHMKREPHHYELLVDLKPGLDEAQLDARLKRDFAENTNKDFKNALDALLPQKLIPVIVALSGIGGETKVNQITKEQRRALLFLLKNLRIRPQAFRPIAEAIITAGGVKTAEIDPSSMASKKVGNLYFIGEVLDLDAYTGGFNLQIAFCTAAACAQAIVQAVAQ